jgi:hypothetical protein
MDIKKIIAKLPVGYVEDSAGMQGDQLRSEIIKAETSLREVAIAQKADEKLAGAKDIVKDIVGAYSDAKKAQRAKIDYTLHLLDERGELLDGDFATDAVTGKPGVAKAKKADGKSRKSA